METRVQLMADGALIGFTYYGKGDIVLVEEENDWHEINIYLLFVSITIKWW